MARRSCRGGASPRRRSRPARCCWWRAAGSSSIARLPDGNTRCGNCSSTPAGSAATPTRRTTRRRSTAMRSRGAVTNTRCSQAERRCSSRGAGGNTRIRDISWCARRSSRRPAWTSSARSTSMVLAPLGIEKSFIARSRADLQRSVFGGEDNFHPGWVAHGLLMGPPSDVVSFMHRLFTGALLPAPLAAAMRERYPVDDRADRPAVAHGGLRARRDDRHCLAARALHRPFGAGARERVGGLSLSRPLRRR